MNIIDCLQGSAEWLAERSGKVTASRIATVMEMTKKGDETAKRRLYRLEIIGERLTGDSAQHYVNDSMKWGTECEPLARAAYEIKTDCDVRQVGLVLHPSIENAAASPDGLVGEDGLLEIKAPETTTHLQWISDGIAPPQHIDQMQFQMACTGRQWCDFASYDPRLPQRYQLFIVRVERDEGRISEINDGVRLFLREVDAQIAALDVRMPELPKPAPQDMGGMGLTNEELDYIIKL